MEFLDLGMFSEDHHFMKRDHRYASIFQLSFLMCEIKVFMSFISICPSGSNQTNHLIFNSLAYFCMNWYHVWFAAHHHLFILCVKITKIQFGYFSFSFSSISCELSFEPSFMNTNFLNQALIISSIIELNIDASL